MGSLTPSTDDSAAGDVVSVLIVDDESMVRQALQRMLAESRHITVVGEATDGAEVEDQVDRHEPAVVLMDLRMPGVDGITATRRLLQRPDPPAVLVLTTFETDADIHAAMRAGAAGYLVKHTRPEQIEAAIRDVAAGRPALSPSVARNLIDTVARVTADESARTPPGRAHAVRRLGVLTNQEQAVAIGVGQGHSNARIAAELFLSVSTVKTYTSKAMAKLHLTNRTQLALLIREAGLL